MPVAGRPASLAFLFELGELEGLAAAKWSPLTDESDMVDGVDGQEIGKALAREVAGELLTFVFNLLSGHQCTFG